MAHAAVNGVMITVFSRHFVKKLLDEGARLHFMTAKEKVFGSRQPIAEMEELGGECHGYGIPQHFAPVKELAAMAQLVVDLRRMKVDFLHTRGSVMGFVGRAAGRLAGVPHIIHHQDDLHFRDDRHGSLKKRLIQEVERALTYLSHKSLFVSDAVLNDALAAGFPADRCVMVGHDLGEEFQRALEEENPAKGRHPLLAELGIPAGKRVIGTIGRLDRIKGFDRALDVAERVCAGRDDCCFLFKGGGPLGQWLEEEIGRRGLEGQVILSGARLPTDEMPWLFRSFDVFFLPTRREGFGMVFAEAMAMGTPVVGPDIAPVNEVVPEDCGLLVGEGDVDSYAEAITRLLDGEQERMELVKRGRERVLGAWKGTRSAEMVLDVYRQLRAARGSGN